MALSSLFILESALSTEIASKSNCWFCNSCSLWISNAIPFIFCRTPLSSLASESVSCFSFWIVAPHEIFSATCDDSVLKWNWIQVFIYRICWKYQIIVKASILCQTDRKPANESGNYIFTQVHCYIYANILIKFIGNYSLFFSFCWNWPILPYSYSNISMLNFLNHQWPILPGNV